MMMNPLFKRISEQLERLRDTSNIRTLPEARFHGNHVCDAGRRLLNLCSNDYLGLKADPKFMGAFFETLSAEDFILGATSSRLLAGNTEAYERLEANLARRYGAECALVFSSGYHANMGILPALADRSTEIFSDKSVHASLIDGIRLSTAQHVRYRHNDLGHLRTLLMESAERDPDRVRIIVTESVFSMDGDVADLRALIELKREIPNVLLYVDEAHAVGVRGKTGLGVAEELDVLKEIDFLVGTFGKAFASVGAFLIADRWVCDWLVNTMRTLIFTTALPSINLRWTDHVLSQLACFDARRERVAAHGHSVAEAIRATGQTCLSASHIVPWVLGASDAAVACSQRLAVAGYYARPIRPPTVPEGTSRIRFSLTAGMDEEKIAGLCGEISASKMRIRG